MAAVQKELGGVNTGDLKPVQACCCSINSCYCVWPDCFGCTSEGIFLCIEEETKCCKCVDAGSNEDKKCCILQEAGVYCVQPTTCCQSTSQCFCTDSRCAFPCTEKVPCMFTLLPFCVVYPGFGCCKTIAELMPEKYGEEAAAATNVTVVVNTGTPDETEMKR
jgi:hypothetical protein